MVPDSTRFFALSNYVRLLNRCQILWILLGFRFEVEVLSENQVVQNERGDLDKMCPCVTKHVWGFIYLSLRCDCAGNLGRRHSELHFFCCWVKEGPRCNRGIDIMWDFTVAISILGKRLWTFALMYSGIECCLTGYSISDGCSQSLTGLVLRPLTVFKVLNGVSTEGVECRQWIEWGKHSKFWMQSVVL